ncbi:hypothetical protein EDD91_1815 [Streptomyces sp. KS 21]|nr:hypothetical protein EDD91_1815 [Streptomyces sp. KS 21]
MPLADARFVNSGSESSAAGTNSPAKSAGTQAGAVLGAVPKESLAQRCPGDDGRHGDQPDGGDGAVRSAVRTFRRGVFQ